MWFVTTLGPIDEEWGPRYSRCVGYFETYSEALECVQNNSLDIAENGYYPYAVVERIRPGLYPDAVAFFFEYLKKINAYESNEVWRYLSRHAAKNEGSDNARHKVG
jgi:hypothetical protein